MKTKTPPITHAEKTKNIAKVGKLYNKKVAEMTTSRHKTKDQLKELESYLLKLCREYDLNYSGVKNILLIRNL